jgi:hypothetical protein
MCTYEEGKRPKRPFPYFNEVMTGFEYTAAVGHIQDGSRSVAVEIIDAIRARYDGRRRNPFDEAECGRHYARAMASWSAFVAWNGFGYDAQAKTLTVDMSDEEGSTFWSTGSAWGTWRQRTDADGATAELSVIEGSIEVGAVVTGGTRVALPGPVSRSAGARVVVPLVRHHSPNPELPIEVKR